MLMAAAIHFVKTRDNLTWSDNANQIKEVNYAQEL